MKLAQLKAAGAEKIFREKVSGARANWPELARLMRGLAAGDLVLVARLDRLARSTRDLLNTMLGQTRRHFTAGSCSRCSPAWPG